jgi:hypothetical protein
LITHPVRHHRGSMSMRPKGPFILRAIKDTLEIAGAALTGIGIPGIEAIPAIPLKIIAICEVREMLEFGLSSLPRFLNSPPRIWTQTNKTARSFEPAFRHYTERFCAPLLRHGIMLVSKFPVLSRHASIVSKGKRESMTSVLYVLISVLDRLATLFRNSNPRCR